MRISTPLRAAFAAALLVGCEDQFQLRVRGDAEITLDGAEPVERVPSLLPTRPDGPHVFDDVGVRLASGGVHNYWREGTWVSSSKGVNVLIDPKGATEIDFAVHPGRHDLNLALALPTSSICELRVRRRPRRDVALFMGSIGTLGGVGGGISVLVDPHPSAGARDVDATALIGGGALLIAGAAMFFWPPGEGRADIDDGC